MTCSLRTEVSQTPRHLTQCHISTIETHPGRKRNIQVSPADRRRRRNLSFIPEHSFPSRFHSPALGGVVTIFGRGWGAPGALPPTGPAQSAATRLCLLAVCTLLITQVVAHCLSRVPRTAMLTDWNERLWECKWSRLIRCRVGRWSQPYVIADSPPHPT